MYFKHAGLRSERNSSHVSDVDKLRVNTDILSNKNSEVNSKNKNRTRHKSTVGLVAADEVHLNGEIIAVNNLNVNFFKIKDEVLEKNDCGLRYVEKVLSIIPDNIEMHPVKDYLLSNGITHEHLRGSIYQDCLNGSVFFNPVKVNIDLDINHKYFQSGGGLESREIEDQYINNNRLGEELIQDYIKEMGCDSPAFKEGLSEL